MARNAIESEFLTSNMADRSEMRSKVIFGQPKWPPAAILTKKNQKKCKVAYRSEVAVMRSKVNFGHPKWPT